MNVARTGGVNSGAGGRAGVVCVAVVDDDDRVADVDGVVRLVEVVVRLVEVVVVDLAGLDVEVDDEDLAGLEAAELVVELDVVAGALVTLLVIDVDLELAPQPAPASDTITAVATAIPLRMSVPRRIEPAQNR
jgi:hypothetical protein